MTSKKKQTPASITPQVEVIAKRPKHVTVGEQDSYASLGVRYAPDGTGGPEFARELFTANAGTTLRPGKTVVLPR